MLRNTPVRSAISSTVVLVSKRTERAAPSADGAALATAAAGTKLMLDAKGRVGPSGYTVAKPAVVADTAVRLSQAAVASGATPTSDHARNAPPLATDRGPALLPSPRTSRALSAAERVSNSRTGFTAVNRDGAASGAIVGSAGDGTAAALGGSVTTGRLPQ